MTFWVLVTMSIFSNSTLAGIIYIENGSDKVPTIKIVLSVIIVYPVCDVIVGTSPLISSHPELVHSAVYTDESEVVCRKDMGQGKRLRKWSRGHQFVVRGSGHIDTWQPLYR